MEPPISLISRGCRHEKRPWRLPFPGNAGGHHNLSENLVDEGDPKDRLIMGISWICHGNIMEICWEYIYCVHDIPMIYPLMLPTLP